MDLQKAVAAARQRITESYAADDPRDIRLESFLYDDHLMVWSLTIGFAVAARPEAARPEAGRSETERGRETPPPAGQARRYTIVRVSETDKSVLSIADR